MKTTAAAIATAILLMLGLVSPVGGRGIVGTHGDVDCDGFITSTDAMVLLQVHANLADPSSCFDEQGDVTRDRLVDSRDAFMILWIGSVAEKEGGDANDALTPI